MLGAEQLLLYGNTRYTPLLADLCAAADDKDPDAAHACMRLAHALLAMAGETGFYGNLFHVLLTRVLIESENSYTLSAERRGKPEGTVNAFALHDMEIFRSWFAIDPDRLVYRFGVREIGLLKDYRTDPAAGRVYGRGACREICELAVRLAGCPDAQSMLDAVTDFYTRFGVGAYSLHRAFRLQVEEGRVRIVPVMRIADVHFDDLVGYESAKELLRRNTEAFLAGADANNCLLYGDAGTGKSTSVKALAGTYYEKGLRIIEIYRHEYRYLNDVIGEIKNRNYRFLLYMDDLSFEEFETEYKYLKAIIEGGLEKKPENVLILATSNRRHLIRESFNDKRALSDDDLHRNDTVQEKLSLYDRFGLTIYYGAPAPAEYYRIVTTLAERAGLAIDRQELLELANQWELKHAGYSGRTARQLVDDLVGRRILAEGPAKPADT